MKRCPQCRHDYYDDSLSYCLEDGAVLLSGLPNEPPTAIIGVDHQTKESPTRTFDPAVEEKATHQVEPPRASLNRLTVTRAVIGSTIVIAALAFLGYIYFSRSSTDRIGSIAVLPFENLSGSADTEYLSDGLADSLIYRLSQLANLKVSPTSSVMRYKGKETDVARIANELKVDAVMSGRLTQLGDDLSISVQLIDARNEKVIWAEQYDRKISDLLAIQREIATTITQKLQLRLSGDEKGIAKKYTDKNEAYQLYLKGRYHWARRTQDDLFKAIDNYKQAIDLDPNFALAYAAIAEVYNSMGLIPNAAPKDSIPFAKAAALRALEIDPMLAEAHSALADSLVVYDWNSPESEKEFKRALELDPNISYIHAEYSGNYLMAVGNTSEGVTEAERAVEMEPLSLINNAVLAGAYIYARQFDKAVVQARRAYDLDPDFPLARYLLSMAYVASGKYDEAISVCNQVSPESPSGWLSVVTLAHAFAKMGKRVEAEQQIAKLNELAKTRYVRRYHIASIYSALGDRDKAFAELQRSIEEKDCYLPRLRVDPFMDPLRDDPRFAEILKRTTRSE